MINPAALDNGVHDAAGIVQHSTPASPACAVEALGWRPVEAYRPI
jgi:hypothetical protein